jgi:predicted lipase
MSSVLSDYFEALERLIKGRPVKVPKGSKITNDNVSMEAGRKKGTIKKSRPVFQELINAIDAAAATQAQPLDSSKAALDAAKADAERYRTLWEEAMTREVSLVKQLWEEQKQWAKEKAALTGEKVTSINSKKVRGEK